MLQVKNKILTHLVLNENHMVTTGDRKVVQNYWIRESQKIRIHQKLDSTSRYLKATLIRYAHVKQI